MLGKKPGIALAGVYTAYTVMDKPKCLKKSAGSKPALPGAGQ